MDGVAVREMLLATLYARTESETDLTTVVDTLAGSGTQLSRQVEVAVAVETLAGEGLLERESGEDGEILRLSDSGRAEAASVTEQLLSRRIEVVDDGRVREVTVEQAATEFDRPPVVIARECSEDGVYYHEDRIDTRGLVNRHEERDALSRIVQRVEHGDGGVAVRLVGPGGNGKTTVGNTLLEERSATVDVVQTGCREAGNDPYQPIQAALDQLDGGALLEVAGFAAQDQDAYEAQQTALFAEITSMLTPAHGIRVLFFDDIDHAGPSTWNYLEYLCEQLPELPLVLVMSHGSGTLPEGSPLHPDEDRGSTWIEIDGLERAATKELIERILGRRGVPDALADAIHERTGGSPLYVEATVETLLETNQLDPQLEWYPTDAAEFDLPDAVNETIQRQMAMFEDDVRVVLEWMAIAGGFVPVRVLQAAAAYDDDRIGTILTTVSQTGMVRRTTRDGEGHVALRNDIVGDALVEQLSAAERKRRHRTVADLLAERTAESRPETGARVGNSGQQLTVDRAATVAFHYERGEDTASAAEWYREAAARATDVYAHETAIEHYYRAIELAREVDDTEAVLSATEQLAETYSIIGEYEQASRHLQFVAERTDEADSDRRQRVARQQARIHAARSEYDDAIETATEAIELAAEPTVETCRLLGVLAEAYEGTGEFDAMAETAERQRDLAADLDQPELEAEARRRLGLVGTKMGEYDDAIENFERSLELFRDIDDRIGEGDSLHGIGGAYYARGEYSRAEGYFQQAHEIKAAIGDRRGHARSLERLGVSGVMQGEYATARERLEQSLDIFREIGDRKGEADCLNVIGIIHFRQREYDPALEFLEQSLALREEIGDKQGQADLLNNLGNISTLQGSYGKARAFLEQSLPIQREIGYRYGESMCLRNTGNIAALRGEYDRAQEYYEHGLDIATEAEIQRMEAMCLNDMGILARIRGEYDRARQLHEESLAIKQESNERHGEAETLNDLGTLARERGDHDRAVDYYERSADIAVELGDSAREALSLAGRCALVREQGAYDQAEAYIERALELTDEVANPSEVGRIRLERGRLALAQSDVASARAAAEQARDTFERLGEPLWIGLSDRLLGDIAAATDTETAREHWVGAVDTFEEIGAPAESLATLRRLVEATGGTEREQWRERAKGVYEDSPGEVRSVHAAWVEDGD